MRAPVGSDTPPSAARPKPAWTPWRSSETSVTFPSTDASPSAVDGTRPVLDEVLRQGRVAALPYRHRKVEADRHAVAEAEPSGHVEADEVRDGRDVAARPGCGRRPDLARTAPRRRSSTSRPRRSSRARARGWRPRRRTASRCSRRSRGASARSPSACASASPAESPARATLRTAAAPCPARVIAL